MERLLKVDEVAERIALHRSKVYELIAAGELPTVTIGRSRRVIESELDEWIRSRVNAAPLPPR